MKIGDKVKLVNIDKDQRARLQIDDICIGQILEIVDMDEGGYLDFGLKFRFLYNPDQFEVVTDDDTKNEGGSMEFVKLSTTFTFSLENLDAKLLSDLSPREKIVNIIFVDNKFVKVNYNFDAPYSAQKWEILSMINSKIKELQKEHDKAVQK